MKYTDYSMNDLPVNHCERRITRTSVILFVLVAADIQNLVLTAFSFHPVGSYFLPLASAKLCDTGTPTQKIVPSGGEVAITSADTFLIGDTHEWVFNSEDDGQFLTLQFKSFDLGGPKCNTTVDKYASVAVETTTEAGMQPYLFCNGRGPYIPFSSLRQLRVVYCNKNMEGKLSFVVSAGCSRHLLVSEHPMSIVTKRSRSPCWIVLRSLSGKGIAVSITNIVTRKAKSNRCQSGYITAKVSGQDNIETSLSLAGREKFCQMTNDNEDAFRDLKFNTTHSHMNITYKNAEFTLQYWELIAEKKLPVGRQPQSTKYQDLDTRKQVTGAPKMKGDFTENTGNSMPQIIGLACGAALVIIALIATLCFVKKRNGRTRRSPTMNTKETEVKDSAKYSKGSGCDGAGFMQRTISIGSVTNAMYDQVIDSNKTTPATTRPSSNGGRNPVDPGRRPSVDVRESRRIRLAELEEKYGPFPDPPDSHSITSSRDSFDSHDTLEKPSWGEKRSHPANQNNYELTRKGTRPFLPPPRTTTFAPQDSLPISIPRNMYETIEDIKVVRNVKNTSNLKVSYDSVAEEEYAECSTDIGDEWHGYPKVSYDIVPDDDEADNSRPTGIYSAIPENAEYLKPLNSSGNIPHQANKGTQNIDNFELNSMENIDHTTFPGDIPYSIVQKSPKIPFSTFASTPLLNQPRNNSDHDVLQYKPQIRNIAQCRSNGAINTRYGSPYQKKMASVKYLSPRPSLPEIAPHGQYISLDSEKSLSMASSLQEDADNYLQPRPSNPETMIACAYSSSEDVTEMRRRLINAAHPSLIDNPEDMTIRIEASQYPSTHYDSPRPSAGRYH